MSECVEPIVGKILAGWRYDISSLAPEMRGDYELHFAGCEHCRSRQKVHRIIDISLIALASASGAVFLLAFAVIRYMEPRHAFWLVVAVATPAPTVMVDVAKLGARHVHDRLPAEIRERVPEEIRVKLTGS